MPVYALKNLSSNDGNTPITYRDLRDWLDSIPRMDGRLDQTLTVFTRENRYLIQEVNNIGPANQITSSLSPNFIILLDIERR